MTKDVQIARLPGWFEPKDHNDKARMPIVTPLEIRNLRDQVRYTASLISSLYPVREAMADTWACEFMQRIIFWRPTSPWPPHESLSPRQILFLIAHEAGHLNFTGGWETPDDWKVSKCRAFATFLNAVEDIRIERLMGREFPGFEEIRRDVNREFLPFHETYASYSYALWDQVGLNWIALENYPASAPAAIGHPNAREFARDLWYDIDRVANADSTNSVAKALIPIFEQLWKEQEEAQQQNRQTGSPQESFGQHMGGDASEGMEGVGDSYPDEPSKNPVKELSEHSDTLSREEETLERARSARGEGKKKLERAHASEQAAKKKAMTERRKVMASNDDQSVSGVEAGQTHNPNRKNTDVWEHTRRAMDPQIRALSHRLRSTLKTNMMSDWVENLGRGSLNTRRARRAVAGNNRIFRRRYQIGAHDYTFGIVDDCSGSMNSGSQKIAPHVLAMTVLLAESFERAGLPYFIVTHDTLMLSGKTIRQPLRTVCEDIGADIALSNGGTYECPALIVAQEQFRQVNSGHKVLFVLSDGKTRDKEHSVQVVDELARDGVRTIGVGLRIPPPDHHPIGVQVDDVTQLPTLLPRMINDIVRKGAK